MEKDRAVEQQSSRAEVRTHHASRFSKSKGFTLTEVALVLVVGGLIIGAVLKGQDLVENARYKQFVTEVKKWEVASSAYMDRAQVFPGDGDADGVVGNGATENTQTDFSASGLLQAPTANTFKIGASIFYVLMGNTGIAGAGGGTGTKTNAIAVCKSNACDDVFTEAEVKYLSNFDTVLDNKDGGIVGAVRGTATALTDASSSTWSFNHATHPAYSAFASSTTKSMLYYFDKRPQ